MRKIISQRNSGKTNKLIEISHTSGDYIVCQNRHEAERILSVAESTGFNIPMPITYEEFTNKRYYSKGIKGFLFDNVDIFLQTLTTVPIKAITLNN